MQSSYSSCSAWASRADVDLADSPLPVQRDGVDATQYSFFGDFGGADDGLELEGALEVSGGGSLITRRGGRLLAEPAVRLLCPPTRSCRTGWRRRRRRS